MTPERYEIYFADLNPTSGREIHKVRPVAIVSQNEMNRYLEPLWFVLSPQACILNGEVVFRLRVQAKMRRSPLTKSGR